jgi:hypothetical protein
MRHRLAEQSAIRIIGSKVTLFIVAIAATALTLILFPPRQGQNIVQDPTANAEAAYQSLLVQMDTPDAGVAVAGVTPTPATVEVGRGSPATGLRRNLFAPVQGRFQHGNVTAAPSKSAAKPSVPRLTGVFIDGGSRQAKLAGTLVSEGDTIRGYLVVEITPEWVLLEREGTTHKLLLGGES